jgi:hypothetical protein
MKKYETDGKKVNNEGHKAGCEGLACLLRESVFSCFLDARCLGTSKA